MKDWTGLKLGSTTYFAVAGMIASFAISLTPVGDIIEIIAGIDLIKLGEYLKGFTAIGLAVATLTPWGKVAEFATKSFKLFRLLANSGIIKSIKATAHLLQRMLDKGFKFLYTKSEFYLKKGASEIKYFVWCRILHIGCFIKDTPVLMAHNPFINVAPAMALATMPLVAPIQDVQVDDMVKAYHHEEMYLTASNDDDLYVPGWQDYDYLDITPETWQVGKLIITEEDGSVVEIEVNRPKEWFEEYDLKENGDEVWLEIEEMDVADYAVLQGVRITDIDTREFELNENGKVDRPVITTYKRVANEISDYTFSNGQVISCTPNHPFYSSDRQDYIPVGELSFGESVQTSSDREIKFIGGKAREKGEPVYNLEVWREHNYYVGFGGSEDFVLVHNSCGRNNKRWYQNEGKNQTPKEHIEANHTDKNRNQPNNVNTNRTYWNDLFDDPKKMDELMDDLTNDLDPWHYKPGSNERIWRATVDATNPKYQKYTKKINGVDAFGTDKSGSPLTKFIMDLNPNEDGAMTFLNGFPIN